MTKQIARLQAWNGDQWINVLADEDGQVVVTPDFGTTTVVEALEDNTTAVTAGNVLLGGLATIITAIALTNTKLDTLIAALVTANAHLAAIETNTGA